MRILQGHHSDVNVVKFHPNGNYLATGSSDRSVRIFDLATGNPVRFFTGHKVKRKWRSNEIKKCLSKIRKKEIELRKLKFYFLKGNVSVCQFSPDGKFLVSGGADGRLIVWEIGNAKMLANIRAHDAPISSIEFSRDGAVLATGGLDDSIKLFSTQNLSTPEDDSSALIASNLK